MYGIVSFSKKPLQAAAVTSLAVAFGGFLLALYSFFDYFRNVKLPSGWTTLVILVLGFSGAPLIFLGIVGEYIGAIFDEVKARPHYIVQEKVNVS